MSEAFIEERGLQYDRRWMLIDENGTFITQRKHFELAMLQVNITDNTLRVSHKENPDNNISFAIQEQTGQAISVSIWDDQCSGIEVSKRVSAWFSEFLNMNVRLIYMPDEVKRSVDPRYATQDEIVSFADGYPCLIIGQSALDALNLMLPSPIRMDRFRPNFVFTGGAPHVEDQFGAFKLGEVLFSAVKPCARCVLITIDQQTGDKGQEPLRTLARYRTLGKKILFGQNLTHKGSGLIRKGDELIVNDWKKEPFVIEGKP